MKLLREVIVITLIVWSYFSASSQESYRWKLAANGGIEWSVAENDSHTDHIEMSGFYISAIVHYGVNKGNLQQKIHLVFPMLRTIPNDTHANFSYNFNKEDLPGIKINGIPVTEHPAMFNIKGILSWQSKQAEKIEISHQLFPSTDEPVFIDKVEIVNVSENPVKVELPKMEITDTTDVVKGVYGSYVIERYFNKKGTFTVASGESFFYSEIYTARRLIDVKNYVSPDYELKKRQQFVSKTFANLVFESPDEVLNREFAFAKLRAVESIYRTKGGLMHGPGGGRYYAAIWANDQAEYANPFFPFLGNLAGNESAINSFRHFARYMNDDYNPIPSSIIAEGTGFWNGAGDRGDMAMIAYGASRFALAYGDEKTARDLWPLIEWCLEYSKQKLNSEGVVTSDCDELENRFPAGKANLNTSSLYFDALNSAVLLGKELGVEQAQLDNYSQQSGALKNSIENYFGASIDGFETYRYFKNNKKLRAWICTPLTVGIFSRAKGTADALFSDKLWTDDGLASESGNKTFWDRATLYALRGVFAAGETKRGLNFFQYYSRRRLLGEHVPYPVEAYPEGNQRHLSAESALYCRVVTEGLWGIRPAGFNAFLLAPKLPEYWNRMVLRNIKAFNHSFNIEVKRENSKLMVTVFNSEKVFIKQKIGEGDTLKVEL